VSGDTPSGRGTPPRVEGARRGPLPRAVPGELPGAGVVAQVAAQLGRPARGLRRVAVWCDAGHPCVIESAALVDDAPWPTRYWLTCPALCRAVADHERRGGVASARDALGRDPALAERAEADHHAHAAGRWAAMTAAERARAEALGVAAALRTRGIGGAARPGAVACLHASVAAELAEPGSSAVGRHVIAQLGLSRCAARAGEK